MKTEDKDQMIANLHERVKKLQREWLVEYRTLQILEAADFVSASKIEKARALAEDSP